MKVMLIVTPTPGFESQDGRYLSVFRALSENISQTVEAEFFEVTYDFEYRNSIEATDLIVLYYHASWLSKPTHIGTRDGLDLLELARQSGKPLILLVPNGLSPEAIETFESELCLPITEDNLERLGKEVLARVAQ